MAKNNTLVQTGDQAGWSKKLVVDRNVFDVNTTVNFKVSKAYFADGSELDAENMKKINAAKAKVLYDYLDGQDFYRNPVQKEYRSMMNVTFTSPDADTDKAFCAAAAEAGFVNLKGHRLVGGMRASIYNAMPAEGIDKLVDFMEKFRKENA